MATENLYYTDAYMTHFEATLVGTTPYRDTLAVELDHTCFYPTGGGQPHDTGWLNGIPVIDVMLREEDKVVLHLLDSASAHDALATQPHIVGQIDWTRRFDHMQHHTGQHILSQAFIQVAQAETIGFHMSPDSITIDLNTIALKPAVIDAAEDLANQIITDNRSVRAWFPTEGELATITLRKVPEVASAFRIVEIQDFDITACGGTHVAHTGEIGMIKVLRVDKRGDALRVEFRCGTRGLLDYRKKNALTGQLAAELTTGYEQIPAALAKLRAKNKTLRRELRTLGTALLEYEADALWQAADHAMPHVMIVQAFENRDVGEVRQLVQMLITHPQTLALCGVAGEKAHLIAARSDDLPYDMIPVLMGGLASWGVARGGGRPSFAQGGGVPASPDQVQTALNAALKLIHLGQE